MPGSLALGRQELEDRLCEFDRAVALLYPGQTFRLALVGGGAMVPLEDSLVPLDLGTTAAECYSPSLEDVVASMPCSKRDSDARIARSAEHAAPDFPRIPSIMCEGIVWRRHARAAQAPRLYPRPRQDSSIRCSGGLRSRTAPEGSTACSRDDRRCSGNSRHSCDFNRQAGLRASWPMPALLCDLSTPRSGTAT